MSYTCRQLELGRTGLIAESKVKWEGSPIPAPYIYYRTSSTVIYAEFCAPGEILNEHWGDIVAAAMKSANAVGLERIAEEPYTAQEAFESSFKTLLEEQDVDHAGEILISFSARQQPNKEWHR